MGSTAPHHALSSPGSLHTDSPRANESRVLEQESPVNPTPKWAALVLVLVLVLVVVVVVVERVATGAAKVAVEGRGVLRCKRRPASRVFMSPLSTTLVEMEKNKGSRAGPPSVSLCQGPLVAGVVVVAQLG